MKKQINIYEVTPNGEALTLNSRKKILDNFFLGCDKKIIFNSGTSYTTPENLLSEVINGDYLLFVEEDNNSVVLIKWSRKFKKDFISCSEETTYKKIQKMKNS